MGHWFSKYSPQTPRGPCDFFRVSTRFALFCFVLRKKWRGYLFFHCSDIFTYGAKAVLGKTMCLSKGRNVAPNHMHNHIGFFTMTHSVNSVAINQELLCIISSYLPSLLILYKDLKDNLCYLLTKTMGDIISLGTGLK